MNIDFNHRSAGSFAVPQATRSERTGKRGERKKKVTVDYYTEISAAKFWADVFPPVASDCNPGTVENGSNF